jgi:phosphoribosyl-AMP cyclohydrolase
MKKGDTSGDVQKVLRVSFDCDADSLLIIVDSGKKFCHLNLKSCYHC